MPLIIDNLFNAGGADVVLLKEIGLLSDVDIASADANVTLFRATEFDGTAVLMSTKWSKQCAWARYDKHFTAVMIHRGVEKLLFVSVYLPDAHKAWALFEGAIRL